MFGGGFKESNAKVVQLPEKYFKDILELMCILHPPNKPVDGMLFTFHTVTHQKTKKFNSLVTELHNLVIADCYATSFWQTSILSFLWLLYEIGQAIIFFRVVSSSSSSSVFFSLA